MLYMVTFTINIPQMLAYIYIYIIIHIYQHHGSCGLYHHFFYPFCHRFWWNPMIWLSPGQPQRGRTTGPSVFFVRRRDVSIGLGTIGTQDVGDYHDPLWITMVNPINQLAKTNKHFFRQQWQKVVSKKVIEGDYSHHLIVIWWYWWDVW